MSIALLKKALKEEDIVYGEKAVFDRLKNGKVKKIFIAKGCKNVISIKRYAFISKVELIELEETGMEVGVACKKPFSIGALCY